MEQINLFLDAFAEIDYNQKKFAAGVGGRKLKGMPHQRKFLPGMQPLAPLTKDEEEMVEAW